MTTAPLILTETEARALDALNRGAVLTHAKSGKAYRKHPCYNLNPWACESRGGRTCVNACSDRNGKAFGPVRTMILAELVVGGAS